MDDYTKINEAFKQMTTPLSEASIKGDVDEAKTIKWIQQMVKISKSDFIKLAKPYHTIDSDEVEYIEYDGLFINTTNRHGALQARFKMKIAEGYDGYDMDAGNWFITWDGKKITMVDV